MRTGSLAFVQVSFGAVREGVVVVGFEPDRLVKVFDSAVVLALFLVSHAAVVEGSGMVGIELDRLIVVLDGTVVLALSGVGVTTVIVRDDEGLRCLLE